MVRQGHWHHLHDHWFFCEEVQTCNCPLTNHVGSGVNTPPECTSESLSTSTATPSLLLLVLLGAIKCCSRCLWATFVRLGCLGSVKGLSFGSWRSWLMVLNRLVTVSQHDDLCLRTGQYDTAVCAAVQQNEVYTRRYNSAACRWHLPSWLHSFGLRVVSTFLRLSKERLKKFGCS